MTSPERIGSDPTTRAERIEANLRRYPRYQALRNAFFWLPVFFLYFLSVLSLEQALLLESLYFAAVVAAEVPSGWLADRLGRRPVLVAATACDAGAAALFALTGSFAPFAVAQGLKAVGHAMNSGADSALLYDSLRELGREAEVAEREGRAFSWGLASTAAAALAGGLLGAFDLRLAWVATALASAGALAVAWRFTEPRPASGVGPDVVRLRQLGAQLRARLADPVLRWVLAFVVTMVVLNHVPYEFFQPYVALLLGEGDGGYALAPPVVGALAAAMALLGAAASRLAPAVGRRLGVYVALLAAMALQLGIVAAMAAALAPWVMGAILLRSVPMGLLNPLVLAEVHPRVETSIRATWLSLQSFAGRLAFAAWLAAGAAAVAGLETSHAAMARVLVVTLAGGAIVAAALALHRPRP